MKLCRCRCSIRFLRGSFVRQEENRGARRWTSISFTSRTGWFEVFFSTEVTNELDHSPCFPLKHPNQLRTLTTRSCCTVWIPPPPSPSPDFRDDAAAHEPLLDVRPPHRGDVCAPDEGLGHGRGLRARPRDLAAAAVRRGRPRAPLDAGGVGGVRGGRGRGHCPPGWRGFPRRVCHSSSGSQQRFTEERRKFVCRPSRNARSAGDCFLNVSACVSPNQNFAVLLPAYHMGVPTSRLWFCRMASVVGTLRWLLCSTPDRMCICAVKKSIAAQPAGRSRSFLLNGGMCVATTEVMHSETNRCCVRSSTVVEIAFSMFPSPLLEPQVYDVMREAGIRPNSRSLLDLVNLCRANGLLSVAARIMRERSKTAATTSRRRSNVSMRRNAAVSTSPKRNKSTRNTSSTSRGSSRSSNGGGNRGSSRNGGGGGGKTGT